MKKIVIIISCIATILVGCSNNTDNIQHNTNSSDKSAELKRTYNKSINGHEYVDLGLSVKWATCNVGASQPHELGYYFAWGEIRPKDFYGSENSETYEVNVGDDIGGNPNLDAATANWRGTWRMPTKWEALELVNRCTWESGSLNGRNIAKVTGPNGNFIILPLAGYCDDGWLKYLDEYLDYWCSTSDNDSFHRYSDCMIASILPWGWSTKPHISSYGVRRLGYPIRPVSN